MLLWVIVLTVGTYPLQGSSCRGSDINIPVCALALAMLSWKLKLSPPTGDIQALKRSFDFTGL